MAKTHPLTAIATQAIKSQTNWLIIPFLEIQNIAFNPSTNNQRAKDNDNIIDIECNLNVSFVAFFLSGTSSFVNR